MPHTFNDNLGGSEHFDRVLVGDLTRSRHPARHQTGTAPFKARHLQAVMRARVRVPPAFSGDGLAPAAIIAIDGPR
ncbi:MAG: hypothetical protein ABIQ16_17665 [Polyangiaceae bacterium]